ncbi:response regulator [Elizabethkingia argentiflava]|uniref:Response regulator n=1 Tax=Elizabethkingia argenteiflava TaxID=2681556 RepID=A0A845PX51_9FLAO|nr:response regulator transcription factor [Elizabethkingia argenteiflava]NAW51521.1 response regulator [Elizabethkingia argenteiflava]
MKILIIEDEKELAESISEYLSEENYLCSFASNVRQALEKIQHYYYDCIILDIMLPDGNGLEILQVLKKQHKQDGIIIVSAKNAVEDRVRGLHLGADDYLTKPFHLSELMARVFSIIRRKKFENSNIIQQNELQVDLLSKTVTIHCQSVLLTKKEFDLLIYFIGNKNKIISKSTLAEHLSGDFADMLDSHDFVYAHVKNLKKKLYDAGCNHYLKTVYGTGYKWTI